MDGCAFRASRGTCDRPDHFVRGTANIHGVIDCRCDTVGHRVDGYADATRAGWVGQINRKRLRPFRDRIIGQHQIDYQISHRIAVSRGGEGQRGSVEGQCSRSRVSSNRSIGCGNKVSVVTGIRVVIVDTDIDRR